MSSPAQIVQAYLVTQGVVQMPAVPNQTELYSQLPGDGTTLCYVSSMPDDPDQVVALYDTAGIFWGKNQRKQSRVHPGIKILARSLDYASGYALVNLIATTLDSFTTGNVVTSDQVSHAVQSIFRVSPIIALGEEVGKKRQLWSLNARVAFQDSEPNLG